MPPVLRRLLLAALVAAAGLGAILLRAARRPLRRPDLGPLPPRSRTITTPDGVDLHVEEDGDTDAPLTVLFVHGFTARLGEFAVQREAVRGRARLVFADLRGHGRSGWGDRRRSTIEQLAADAEVVLDEMAPSGPVVLVGHSLGGMVVLAMARRRPELLGTRVVGVFLLATSAGDVVDEGPIGSTIRVLKRLGLFGASLPLLRGWLRLWAPLVEQLRRPGTAAGRAFIRRALFGTEDAEPEVVTLVQQMLEEAPFRISAAFYASFLTHDENATLPLLGRVPVAVVCGSDDRLTPLRASRRITDGIGPSAELTVVRGAGHSVNISRHEVVDGALHALLDRAEAYAAKERSA